MFDRFKDVLGKRKPKSYKQQIATFDLEEKPFTKALLLRASHYHDVAIREISQLPGHTKSINQAKTLVELVASSAVTIAHEVTNEAAKSIGSNTAFLPHNPLPKNAAAIVAFSLFILVGIKGQLDAEELQIDFQELSARTANLFYMLYPDNERAKYAMEGYNFFQIILKSDSENVKSWFDTLISLIPVYVFQWTAEDEELRNQDLSSLFGGMLSSLTKAID